MKKRASRLLLILLYFIAAPLTSCEDTTPTIEVIKTDEPVIDETETVETVETIDEPVTIETLEIPKKKKKPGKKKSGKYNYTKSTESKTVGSISED